MNHFINSFKVTVGYTRIFRGFAFMLPLGVDFDNSLLAKIAREKAMNSTKSSKDNAKVAKNVNTEK